MKENGRMIKLRGMGYIYIKMERSMKDIGKMIFRMDMVLKFGNG